ncbi:M1 family metallopeptidase, partial [bacterium]|nr:M1 family metallopeptidase [bacterium]
VAVLAGGVPPAGAAPRPAPPVCKAGPVPLAARIGEPAPPPGDRGYDVTDYDLDLRFDPVTRTVTGTVGVRATALATLDRLQLDLVPEMVVTSASDGVGELAWRHEDARLEVFLRAPAAAGTAITVNLAWSGAPPRHGAFAAGLMFRTHDAGTPADTSDDVPVIANMSQPWSAHSWWPCKDLPEDKARVRLAGAVPEPLRLVSNGRLVGITSPAPGWRRFAWEADFPLPPYLVSVAASDYASWSQACAPAGAAPLTLTFHAFPPDSAAAAHDLAPTCAMYGFLADRFGPWPFPGYGYAQAEIKWIGAMEHTTATSISQLLLTGDGRYETLVVHELAHHWFGDSLTPAAWADIWLNEGFARYAEALWVEEREGGTALRDFMAGIGADGHPGLFVGEGVLADPEPILPNLLVYDKGAWVLHMLRGLLGDAVFADLLRDYADDPRLRRGLTTTPDFVAAAERAAGRRLDGFFRPWLETDLVPEVALDWATPAAGTVVVTATQRQDGPLFELPLPLVLSGPCGDTRLSVLLTDRRGSWQFAVACPVDSVRIDPAAGALVRPAAAPPPPLVVRGPVPQPAGADGATFTLFLAEERQVIVKTYDISGKLVQEFDLGRVPATPLSADPATAPTWTWRPVGPGGRALPSGLLLLEFRAGTNRVVPRVVLVR